MHSLSQNVSLSDYDELANFRIRTSKMKIYLYMYVTEGSTATNYTCIVRVFTNQLHFGSGFRTNRNNIVHAFFFCCIHVLAIFCTIKSGANRTWHEKSRWFVIGTMVDLKPILTNLKWFNRFGILTIDFPNEIRRKRLNCNSQWGFCLCFSHRNTSLVGSVIELTWRYERNTIGVCYNIAWCEYDCLF